MSTSKKKVLVIGLDSATFDLLKPWMTDGYLPVLARLVRDGASGELRSTLPPHTAPAWSSFMTGKNPGKHGIFGLMRLSSDHTRLQLASSADRKSKDLWEILSEHGKRVVVLEVPVTYPIRPVNGVLVSGFMTPPSAKDFIYPPELEAELQHIGVLGSNVNEPGTNRGDFEESVLQELNRNLEDSARTARHFLASRDWDFFMLVIQGTDEVQHKFWHLMDRSHPNHDTEKASKYGNAIREYYRRVDQIIGKILAEINGQETTVIVVSDHGARAMHKVVSINNLLWRNGLLVFKGDLTTQLKLLAFRIGLTPINLYRVVLKLRLAQVRKSIAKEENRSSLRPFLISLLDLDWTRTKAYSLGGWGQVFLMKENIEQGKYESVREQVIELLLATKDPQTGGPVFSRDNVFLREQIYHGPFLESAPDILAFPNSPYMGYPDYEFGFNSVLQEAIGTGGTHAINGILVIEGAGIKQNIVLTSSIEDLAPTILYLMGIGIPNDMDGKVIFAAIRDDCLAANPPSYDTEERKSAAEASYPYSTQEDERMKQRLKDLGYL